MMTNRYYFDEIIANVRYLPRLISAPIPIHNPIDLLIDY